MRAAVFPDSEALVVQWLAAELPVSVTTDLNGWRAGNRRVVITRTGGVPSLAIRVDNPRIDVDVFADTKESAHDLAQQARAAVHEMPSGDFTDAGAVVANVTDELGLAYIPDPDTRAPRYVFALRLAVHPYP